MRIALVSTLLVAAWSLAPPHPQIRRTDACLTRRTLGGLLPALAPALVALPSQTAFAADLKKDCIKDCVSNCNRVAPGNKAYCAVQCEDYCAQDDRKDGLSGSVSSEGGEVGWTSYARGGNTVEYGADAPPQMDILPKSLLPKALRGGS